MNAIKRLFIFVLLLFPLGEIVRIDFGNGLVIKPLDIGMGILFFSWIALKLFKKQKIVQVNVLLPVILFALAGLLSLIVNSLSLSLGYWLISFAYLLRWIIYASIFFIADDFNKKFKKRIQNLLIVVGSLIIGLGYVQYFYYSNLENLRYLGWDEHMHRMFSVFFDPNFAGAFFVLFFIFLISILLKKKSVFIGFLSILTLGAVFLTFSRSALIMLIVSSSILFIFMSRKKLILWLLIIILITVSISSKYFNIANINLFRVVSSEARLETAKKAIEIIGRHPFLGVGFNAYRYAELNASMNNNRLSVISHADAGVDNSYLFVIATTGIIGFVLYLFLWLRMLKISSVLAIASISGVFIDSMFINSLFYPFIMLWLWIIVAIKENK